MQYKKLKELEEVSPKYDTPLPPEAQPKYSEKPPENENVSPKSDIFELYKVRLSKEIQ